MDYYVYILSNESHTLYIGFTGDLPQRIHKHRTRFYKSAFTARYTFNRLVYFEVFGTVEEAMKREKQIKGWKREKKVALIQSKNPRWHDLSLSWTDALALT